MRTIKVIMMIVFMLVFTLTARGVTINAVDNGRVTGEMAIDGDLSQAMTGTVSATNGSATITGSGTDFLYEVEIGAAVKIESDVAAGYEIFTVAGITNDTSLTVDSTYQGSNDSGLWIRSDPQMLDINNGDGVDVLTVDTTGYIGVGVDKPVCNLDVYGIVLVREKTLDIPHDQAGLWFKYVPGAGDDERGAIWTYDYPETSYRALEIDTSKLFLQIDGSDEFTLTSTTGTLDGTMTADGFTDGTFTTTGGHVTGLIDVFTTDAMNDNAFGKTQLGMNAVDAASFGYRGHGATNFAVYQASSFATTVKAGSGQGIAFYVNSTTSALTLDSSGNATFDGTLTVDGDQSGADEHVFDDYNDIELLYDWREGKELPFKTGDMLNRDRLLRDTIVQMHEVIKKLEKRIETLEKK